MNPIDIPFRNYRNARAFSQTPYLFSSMDGKESRGRRCLGGCNDEARAIFIEIEVAHAMANIRARV